MKTVILGIVTALFLALALAGCGITSSATFEDTLSKMNEIDSRYGLSLHDYDTGIVNIRYNPRFPDPLNADEVDGVVAEFDDLRKDLGEGTASILLVDSRVDLLESEKYFKLATKTKKGLIADGFNCDERPYIEEATQNFKMSILHGRSAVENLRLLAEDYPDQAEQVNVTRFWVKYLNTTYDLIEDDAVKSNYTFYHFCIFE